MPRRRKYARVPGPRELERLLKEQAASLRAVQKAGRLEILRVAHRALETLKQQLSAMVVSGGFSWVVRQAALAQVRYVIGQLLDQQQSIVGAGARVAAARSARFVAQQMNLLDAIFSGGPRLLAFDTLAWAGANSDSISRSRLRMFVNSFRRYGEAVVREIELEVVKNIALGIPWPLARERVHELTKSVVGDKTWMVDRILVTETSHAWNGTQQAALEAEDRPDDPMMKQLVATFDRRTGKDSVLLHGQVRPVKEPFYDGYHGFEYMHPPNRPRDREIIVGFRKSHTSSLV